MRWLSWESGHWDAESVGMVSFEKGSKVVMSLGSADPAFIKRGEQNFARFASVLDGCLAGKTWLLGDRLTIADFAVGGGSSPMRKPWIFHLQSILKYPAGTRASAPCPAGTPN
jgi:glutathione S-transferase